MVYGFKISQSDTYTLVEKKGDELKLSVQIQQTAPEQTVTFAVDNMTCALDCAAGAWR